MSNVLMRLALLSAVVCTGCPDPGGKFDTFLADTVDKRSTGGGPGAGTLADVNGSFILGLSAVSLPGNLLQFYTTVELDETVTPATASMQFYPLKTFLSTDRNPVGPDADNDGTVDPIDPGAVDVTTDGNFEIPFGEVTLTGEANAISGSDLVADLTLIGAIQSEDIFCGAVSGNVTEPAALDLTGSFFGAYRLSDDVVLPTDAMAPDFPAVRFTTGTMSACPGAPLEYLDPYWCCDGAPAPRISCPECAEDSDCDEDAGEVCSEVAGNLTCALPCTDDAECGDNGVCGDEVCQPDCG